ncbi:thioredoxin family protein [sulfur-oxidizing endosymbiont of Gigantopelta aegis]|uniref:thioredoxin family protein n=1 Tax=sulfur-oxidizing endosymbiont of Gigantopelta aegis TaxID=2794934 RepID=UPI001BE43B59|nr:thioredoxin fold domain-containing protein [sulfur-oxidizing endosymbiont of Gigantopelta aegis]
MKTDKLMKKIVIILLAIMFSHALYAAGTAADDWDEEWENGFDDRPVIPEVATPEWFKKSFMVLPEDITEAVENGKKGIIVYFGQKHCAYCQALMEQDFGRKDIEMYTRKNFDVIAVNIWGSNEVTTPDGQVMTEREYALRERANFTPTLIFYNEKGEKALMLRGFYPPYKFRAAMEYVEQGYYKEESLRDYMFRANPPPRFEVSALNNEDFFMMPPYALDRSHFKAQEPLLVFFEQQDCHACDVLHSDPLEFEETRKLLSHFEIVQLDMHSDTPIITPNGQRITARQWAEQLNLFYAPTLIAFDERGNEIIRIESVAHVYRLKNVLEFIVNKTYIQTPEFMNWRFDNIFGGKQLPQVEAHSGSERKELAPQGTSE